MMSGTINIKYIEVLPSLLPALLPALFQPQKLAQHEIWYRFNDGQMTWGQQ